MRTVDVKIVNFWKSNKGLTTARFLKGMHFLTEKYGLKESNNPRFVFSICNPLQFGGYRNVTRIFFAGENIKPRMSACDWAFGFTPEDVVSSPRYMRLPNYVRLGGGTNLIKNNNYVAQNYPKKTKFCAFVSRNPTKVRKMVVNALSKYKKVDCAGPLFNNVPLLDTRSYINKRKLTNRYLWKIRFYEDYKFIIAIENELSDGYTTEKLYHGMLGKSVPIYWGNPLIHREFNTKSFVNAHDCSSTKLQRQIDYLVDRVVELDKDDSKYRAMMSEPFYANNKLNKYADPRRIMHRFNTIFSGKK